MVLGARTAGGRGARGRRGLGGTGQSAVPAKGGSGIKRAARRHRQSRGLPGAGRAHCSRQTGQGGKGGVTAPQNWEGRGREDSQSTPRRGGEKQKRWGGKGVVSAHQGSSGIRQNADGETWAGWQAAAGQPARGSVSKLVKGDQMGQAGQIRNPTSNQVKPTTTRECDTHTQQT